MRFPLRRTRYGLLALLFLCAAGTPATAAPRPDVAVPVGIPIQLDGRAAKAEWDDALAMPLGDDEAVLRLKQFRGMAMIAFEANEPWEVGSQISIYVTPHDAKNGWLSPGGVWINFEPIQHDRSHLIVRRQLDTHEERVWDQVVARAAFTPTSSMIELAFGLDLLGLGPAPGAKVRMAAQWIRPGGATRSPTYPAGLDLGARVGTPPPDLGSAANWAVLHGWTGVGGPGAIDRIEWTRLLDEAKEIMHRAMRAYGTVGEHEEEQTKIRKVDARIHDDVLANFAWIAEREPLAPVDHFTIAKAYRFLNRYDEALAILRVLATGKRTSITGQVEYELARTLESAESFEEADAAWRAVARANPRFADAYIKRAEAAAAAAAALEKERAAREADDERGDLPEVLLQTSRGAIVIRLYAKDVPYSVKHFLELARSGFYDGTLFHRVISQFMAQGGDPKSREDCALAGSGASPHMISPEKNERHTFFAGAVGFARSPRDPRTGSQFFIMTAPKPALSEQDYVCFGHVISGMDVAKRLEHCDRLISARVVLDGVTDDDAADGGADGDSPQDDPKKDDGQADGSKDGK